MRPRSSALLALLALAGCAERDQPAPREDFAAARFRAPTPKPLRRIAAEPEAVDRRPPLDAESTAMVIAAYRFELSLHASDADIEEFGGFFLEYPAAQEGAFLAAFSRNAPAVRQKRWCRFTPEQAVVDLMTAKPGASFVAEIKDLDLRRGEGLVAMSWWTDPELGAGAIMALRKQAGSWEVTGYQLLRFR